VRNATRPRYCRRRAWCSNLLRPAAAWLALLPLTVASAHLAGAQTSERPNLSIPAIIAAEPAGQVLFPIRVERGPRDSLVRVRGLPPKAALSGGYAIAPGAWAVPLNALPGLKITLPSAVTGKSDMVVTLVAADGTVLVETRSTLLIGAALPSAAEDRKRAQQFLKKGHERLAEGLVAQARLLYERAADLGLAEAAMALAATYDPAELNRPHLRSVPPDLKEARRWYQRARELGAPEAEQRLRRQ
jgi:hypothetical protein